MPEEIERKFLVDNHKFSQVVLPTGEEFRQGYLLSSSKNTIRVRIAPTSAFLTIKGAQSGFTRKEFEYPIPIEDAMALLEEFSIGEIRKVRYKIPHRNSLWEVDAYLGEHQGLVVAEIELENEGDEFSIPDWISKEITGDERYFNSFLAGVK